jgi:hypothetical protein
VQFHDEPYALWHRATSRTRPNLACFDDLLAIIRDWDVFLASLIVDGSTAGKSREPLRWFFREIEGKVPATSFGVDDIL